MKKSYNEEGFTLIEVIIAITILMIVIFAFTTLYTTSFSGIFSAGRKSEALFLAQEAMDNLIAEEVNSGTETLTIEFVQRTISVTGEELEVPYEYEGRTGTIYYFLPKGN